MYKSFYGFEFSGFRLTSDRSLRFRYDGYTGVFDKLLQSVRRGSGFVVLTGASGTGKTSLIVDLAARLESDGCVVGKVDDSLVEAGDLPRLIGFAFGLQADAFGKARLLTLLKEQLIGEANAGKPILLLIDEAQDLSIEALEELYLLFDLIAGRGRIVQIVLAGQEQLWERLHRPECKQILRLVVESCRILPLSPTETRDYIGHALKLMGWTGDPEISADALRLIHQRTGGVPRLINLTMGRLLLHGSLGELHALDFQDAESVLEQLAEDHPDLRVDRSNHQLPLRPASAQPIRPLDAGFSEDVESQEPRPWERFLSAIKRNKWLEEKRSLYDRTHIPVGGSSKGVLAGLAAAAIALFLIFAVLSERNRSVPSTTHEEDREEATEIATKLPDDRTVSTAAETPLDPSAHMTPLEPAVQIVDSPQGVEEIENLAPDSVSNESGIAGAESRPVDSENPFTSAPATVTSAETADTEPPSSEQIGRQDQPAEPASPADAGQPPRAERPVTVSSAETDAVPQIGPQRDDRGQMVDPELAPGAHEDPLADVPAIARFTENVEAAGAVPPGGGQTDGLGQKTETDEKIRELLAQAELALSKNRLTVPSADNAYAYYQAVFALDPENAPARDGMRRILERYRQLAQQRLGKRDRRGARLYASRGLKIWPQDATLLEIKRKTVKRRVVRTRRSQPEKTAEKTPEMPEFFERVEKWFRSGNTKHSEFLNQ